MTVNIYAAPAADLDVPALDIDGKFYVVSPRKLAVLHILTLGAYAMYWFYRNWRAYKESQQFGTDDSTLWPVPRAVFAVFFTHSLFRKIKEAGAGIEQVAQWGNNGHASLLVLLMIVSNGLDRASTANLGSPYTDWIAMLLLVPLVFCLLKAQEIINLTCGDPHGEGNSTFTGWNYFWIVLGSCLWIAILVGTFLPEQLAD
ncbi:MAG: hypothetical protein V4857_22670 [Pseudomonadota bacterium]